MKVKNTTRRHRIAAGNFKRSLGHLTKQGRRSASTIKSEDADAPDRPR